MPPDSTPQPPPPGRLTIGRAVAMYGGMTLVAWLISELAFNRSPLLAPGAEGVDVLLKLGLGAGVGIAVVAIDALLERLLTVFREMSAAFARLLGKISGVEAIVYAVFSAVGEEIAFRGVLQSWLGIVPASVLFGLLHIAPDRRLWLWPLLAMAMGFAFGGLFEYTGDVLAPILAHFTINYFGFVRLSRERPGAGPIG